jgi:hypothetical protein
MIELNHNKRVDKVLEMIAEDHQRRMEDVGRIREDVEIAGDDSGMAQGPCYR